MNNYILNLLNIEDKNIEILTEGEVEYQTIKDKQYMVIEGILTYTPEFCPCCGVMNNSCNDIIKWGYRKNCKIKIPKISNLFSLLILHKQRFLCKHCNNTFIAETSIIDRNKNISKNIERQICIELTKKQSEKDIAKRLDVSPSKINSKLNEISSDTILRHEHLPKSMNWDEFKATKDTLGKMAFIVTNNDNGDIFDIKNSRKSQDIEKFFMQYPYYERNKVEHVSLDFYAPYIKLAEKLFKNAAISIDRFHIVTQVYVALNNTRIKLCYKSNPNYNKLKHYWKLILKNKNELSDEKYYSKYFKKDISQKEIVEYLIDTDKEFKATYECYQKIIISIKNRNFDEFKNTIYQENKDVSEKMIKAMNLYKNNIKYIENSFKYDINNGIIEGNNNLIKCIKRIAFGYRNFKHFTARIFLIKYKIKE